MKEVNRSGKARVGIAVAQALGHVTYEQNLKRHLALRDDCDPCWIPVPMFVRDALERMPIAGLRTSIRARIAVTAAEANQAFDALLVHTDSMALALLDVMRRTPTVLSVDATPRSLHEFAAHYRHGVDSPLIERAKEHWNRAVYRQAAAIVSMSEWAKRSLVDEYDVPACKVTVVPPSIDTSVWCPASSKPRDGVARILFVGGDFTRKGGDLLLRWAASTREKNWEMHLVTREAVPSLPNVHVHRFESNSDGLLRLAQRCDVFALPTRGDCSPFALAEAMAAGLPVVSTKVGGVPEFVVEGETGLTVPVDDYEALAKSLSLLVRSPLVRQAMSAAARRRALLHHDLQHNYRRVVNLLLGVARPGFAAGGSGDSLAAAE